MKFAILAAFLLFSHISFAEVLDLYSVERDVEKKILDLAQVHFGSSDTVAVKVQAISRKSSVSDESFDVGYLPLPYERSLTKNNIMSDIEKFEINIIATSRVDKAAVRNLQKSITRLLAPTSTVIKTQVAQFNEPESKTAKADAARAKEQRDLLEQKNKADKKENIEQEKDKINLKDLLYSGIFFLAMLLVGILILTGMRSFGQALNTALDKLSLAFRSQSGARPEKEAEEVPPPKDVSYRQNENISHVSSLRQSLELLKGFCQSDPLKIVSSLSESAEDVAGLRWLLSRLNDEERASLKGFLGDERLKVLSGLAEVPQGFNILVWSQNLIEKITLRKMTSGTLLESIFENAELISIYKIPEEAYFNFALEEKNRGSWKLAFEVLSESHIKEKSDQLTAQDWQLIVESKSATANEVRQAFKLLAGRYRAQDQTQGESLDMLTNKIVPTLVSSLKKMNALEEMECLRTLSASSPEVIPLVKKLFWSYPDLKYINPVGLQSYIERQSNEILFALLLMAPETDRDFIKEMIPQGMKKTVVLDLLDRAIARGSEEDQSSSLRLVREFFDKMRIESGLKVVIDEGRVAA